MDLFSLYTPWNRFKTPFRMHHFDGSFKNSSGGHAPEPILPPPIILPRKNTVKSAVLNAVLHQQSERRTARQLNYLAMVI